MSLHIAFYYPTDDNLVAMWDNIVRAYDIANVSVISDTADIGPWSRIETFQNISGPKVFFSPLSAKYFPGTVALSDYSFPEDVTLCFGADDKHNEVEPFDGVVYIPTIKKQSLYAVQAAILVLDRVA
jgi:hypothetical protein